MELIKQSMVKTLQKTYRDPWNGFSSMDFYGSGKIDIEAVLNNLAIKNLAFPKEDCKTCLERDGVFSQKDYLDFDTFKRHFFPQLVNVNAQYDIEDEEDQTLELRRQN